MVRKRCPHVLKERNIARLVSTVFGNGAKGTPDFTSECFPYGGYYLLRKGWEHTDPHLLFFCSQAPGANAGFLSGRNNNSIGIAAYGQDMIGAAGAIGVYQQRRPPIRVDGWDQDFFIDRGDYGPGAWDDPNPWRWHTSTSYDVCEGVYAAP